MLCILYPSFSRTTEIVPTVLLGFTKVSSYTETNYQILSFLSVTSSCVKLPCINNIVVILIHTAFCVLGDGMAVGRRSTGKELQRSVKMMDKEMEATRLDVQM